MVCLTIFKNDSTTWKELELKEFETIQDALMYGQHSGHCYQIDDADTGGVIEFNEANEKEEEEWVYDDKELIWKRNLGERWMNRLFSLAVPCRDYNSGRPEIQLS